MFNQKGLSWIAIIIIIFLIFLISPFLYKGITGQYPPGFPKEGFNKIIPPPEAFRQSPVDKIGKLGKPVKGPTSGVKKFNSLILFELDDVGSVRKAKELGANAVTLMVDIGVLGNEFSLPKEWRGRPFNLEQVVGPFINEAHKQGLYVELRTSQSPYAQPSSNPDDRAVEESFVKVIEQFATLAQKYQIYQFSISIEADTLVGYAYKQSPEGLKQAELMTRYAKLGKDAAKKYYSGRLGIGLGMPQQHLTGGYLDKIDFAGFDYFTFSSYPSPQKDSTLANYFNNRMIKIVDAASQIAKRNNIPEVILAETGVLNPGENMPGQFGNNFNIRTDLEEEAQFYSDLFAKSEGLIDGYTIFYEFPLFSIKNQPAEEVVKEWYKKL